MADSIIPKRTVSNAPAPIEPVKGGYSFRERPKITPADYDTWVKADLWTVERGILLLLGAEKLPGCDQNSGRCQSSEEQAIFDKFMHIWDIAQGSIKVGKLAKIGKGYPHYWDCTEVYPADFIAWARSKDFQIPAELARIETLPQAETIQPASTTGEGLEVADNWRNDQNLIKSEKQKRAILTVIAMKRYEPMAIPNGEKGTIRTICESDYPELFDGSSSFDNVWKTNIGKSWRMANHASYSKRHK